MGVLGVLARAAFILAAGGKNLTFLSGGSDAPTYHLLAENLLAHKGFAFAGQPSAFRPPGYPLILAGFMAVFGSHYTWVIRWLQFLLGLWTLGICAQVARRLLHEEAARAAFLLGLFLPTLIFSTAQLLTECVSAFLTALFLLFLVRQKENADLPSAAGMGATAALESLIRFNAGALLPIAMWAAFQARPRRSQFLRPGIVLVLFVLIVSPWLIRNAVTFHGAVLYSTHTGANAVQGVVSTQGRTQPGDTQRLIAAMGWCLPDLETNEPSRLSLPPEAELNRRAMSVVPGLWKAQGWRVITLLMKKFADFWLSTDQLMDTASLPWRGRFVRATGVLAYWVVLAVAIGGWFHLRQIHPGMAKIFLVYATLLTAMHLPLVMNTRLRIPLMEPLVVILSGAGWVSLSTFLRKRERKA